jgi:hypothetical protein
MSTKRKKRPSSLTFAKRAAAKQQSREQDAKDLASGRKTSEQLRLENSHFRDLAREPILWDETEPY